MADSTSTHDNPEALLAQLTQLREVLDHVGAYVFTKDLDGRYTYANAMVCELFGLPREAIVGRSDEDFFDLQRSSELRINDLHVLEGGERIEREETNVIAGTGETRVYWTVKLPLRDDGGRIVGMCGISTDITTRRTMEAKVREQKCLLDTVLDNLDAYVYMKDVDRRYLYANANVAELFRIPQAQIPGRLDEEMLPADVAARLAILDRQVLQGGVRASGEESFANARGEMRHYWSVKIPLFDGGRVESLVGISTDITEVAQLKQEYQRLSNTDPLTGISNRRHLLDMAEQELRRSRRQQSRIALLFFDIDHFKQINDHNGHGAGDRCLQQVVASCRERLRDSDLFGRIGGDEFVAVLPDTDAEGALQVAESLRAAVAATPLPMPSGSPLPLRCSFGLALSRPDDCIDTLLARADAALLRAKAEGRDRVLGED